MRCGHKYGIREDTCNYYKLQWSQSTNSVKSHVHPHINITYSMLWYIYIYTYNTL